MFHNYFFTKRLANSLNQRLSGATLVESFSQQKDEIILGFSLIDNSDFYTRASLDEDINLISFPNDFHRAKKNSVDLFEELIDKKITKVDPVAYDRSFYLTFEDGALLLFKLHGNRSNIILLKNQEYNILFKNKLGADRNISLDKIEKNALDYNQISSEEDLIQLEKIAGKEIKAHLVAAYNYYDLPLKERIELFQKTIKEVDQNPIEIIANGKPAISLLGTSDGMQVNDPIQACNRLYRKTVSEYLFEKEKNRAIIQINNRIKQSENYIGKNRKKLDDIKNRRSYEEIANIIMANLHVIKTGQSKVKLFDFYAENDIEIKLKKDLSPQKNAEQYYRKGKNEKIEIRKLDENIKNKENSVIELLEDREELERIDNYKDLRKKISEAEVHSRNDEKLLPYKKFIFDNYEIRVGKNAASNDELTLRYAHKEDLWLHARDVAGSHVVVRSNKNKVPEPVIEYAAGLAAYYSKRKQDTLCPVIVTKRKYVRKGKGMGAGKVIVDKEEVVMVSPITPH